MNNTLPDNPWDPKYLASLKREKVVKNIPKKKEEPWYEDLAEGVVSSGMSTYYGIKDLIPGVDLDQEDRARLKDWTDDADESGWGTGGKVLGEIAQLALPAGLAVKGAKALSKGKALYAGVIPAIEAISAAGLGGAKLPGEGETRGMNALKDGVLSGIGSGFGHIAGNALKGIKITPMAQSLKAKGVYLTPGQASESQGIKRLEDILEVTPGTSRGTKVLRQKGSDSWTLQTIKEAAPNPAGITKIGKDGFNQLERQFQAGYAQAWDGIEKINPKTIENMLDTISDGFQYIKPEDTHVLKKLVNGIEKFGTHGADPKKFKSLDKLIREQLNKVPNDNVYLKEMTGSLKSQFRSNMPKKKLDKLQYMDSKWPAFLTIQKATASAAKDKGSFSPIQSLNAGKIVGGERKMAGGKTPLYKISEQGLETVGRPPGAQPLNWLRRLSDIIPSPGMETGGRIMMGETVPQQFIKKGLRKTPKDLKEILALSRLNVATNQPERDKK